MAHVPTRAQRQIKSNRQKNAVVNDGKQAKTQDLRGVPPRSPILKSNFLGMIKKIIFSKVVSTASGECFILGLKLADGEAHALRLVGLFLFLASVLVLVLDWRKEAAAAAAIVSAPLATTKNSRKHSRSRTSRAR
jgi:hypothetical protein